jgi:hypothetical protein
VDSGHTVIDAALYIVGYVKSVCCEISWILVFEVLLDFADFGQFWI